MTQRNKGSFRSIALLNVEIDLGGVRRQVGRLAWRDRLAYFEYDQGFLTSGLDLSPFRLKLGPGLMEGPPRPFDGLHGLFNDSLPDGWGRLLMDRKLHQIGLHPGYLTPLDRLAWIGAHGMGALIYRPEHPSLAEDDDGMIDLDKLAGESRKVLNDSPRAVLDELLTVGAWLPAPAYDVTFCMGHGGEHALDIAGSGNPGIEHLFEVADEVGVTRSKAQETIDRVRYAVSRWPEFADAGGVSKKSIASIDLHLNGPPGEVGAGHAAVIGAVLPNMAEPGLLPAKPAASRNAPMPNLPARSRA